MSLFSNQIISQLYGLTAKYSMIVTEQPYKEESSPMYRYFIQPQLDVSNQSLVGYELLIRQKRAGQWVLPHDFGAIPIAVQSDLIRQTAQKLRLKIGSVSFNTNQAQFIDPQIAQAILTAQQQIYPVTLVLEVTEEPTTVAVTTQQIIDQVRFFHQRGIQLSLDDVGTGLNTYPHLKPILGAASEVKFALQNFRQAHREAEIPTALKFWQEVATREHLRFILEGVETPAEDTMANQLGLNLRQGWYYGKPHLFKLTSTD